MRPVALDRDLRHTALAHTRAEHGGELVALRGQDRLVRVDGLAVHDERHVAPCRVVHEALMPRENGGRQRDREAEKGDVPCENTTVSDLSRKR